MQRKKVSNKRILFVVNCPAFFLSHRLHLALTAMENGFEVHVATMPGECIKKITAFGLTHHCLPLTRSGKNIFLEILIFVAIYRLFRRLHPDLVHLVTIKPVLYGGIAARIARVPSVVSAVSGLGFVFITQGLKASMIKFMVTNLYRLSFGKKNLTVIFQNEDDREYFVKSGVLKAEKTTLIAGSGVDVSNFRECDEPDGKSVVIMASRLLRDKGVNEFVRACEILRSQDISAEFLLAGAIDPHNPASLSEAELEQIQEKNIVKILGNSSNIPELFAASNIVVLPSYREGLPKILLEAAAAGRAVITTNVPGCRDAIRENITGVLVPVRDSAALALAIKKLVQNDNLRKSMGENGRLLAEREFAIEKIIQLHMNVYEKLLICSTSHKQVK